MPHNQHLMKVAQSHLFVDAVWRPHAMGYLFMEMLGIKYSATDVHIGSG